MTDEGALLAGVLVDSGVDLPRLVLADRLRENGQWERGEFIGVQCELAGWGEGPYRHCAGYARERKRCGVCVDCQEVDVLRERERELLTAHEWDWLHAIHPELHRGSYSESVNHWLHRPQWKRGFLDSFTIDSETFLEIADAVTWCWGKCSWCKGSGMYYPPGRESGGPIPPWEKCGSCSGLGRVGPTMVCPAHQPDRIVDQTAGGSHTYRCPTCKGSGRVPRPCPATAQPITHVHLTTMPDRTEFAIKIPLDSHDTFTSDRWPGITFHLPQTFEQEANPVPSRRDERGTYSSSGSRRGRR